MVKSERFIIKKQFVGAPKEDDFELVTEEQGELQDGEVEIQTEFISVDPYQRGYVKRLQLPRTMIGSNVAKVVASKNKDFPVGETIVSYAGWVKSGKVDPAVLNKEAAHGLPGISIAPKIEVSNSLLLGACGMPGNSAYFGFLELCRPKPGETVVVTGAAGAVGSLVGQIAKIKGCKVIGYAGSDDKVKWLVDELGFDHAFNYKKTTVEESLKIAAPNGVDCFFDNVGGDNSSHIIAHMNPRGRISVCGAVSTYNATDVVTTPAIQGSLVFKQLVMEGFLVVRWLDRWNEGILQMAKWIKEGKIKTKETFVQGFENTPKAFMGLLSGENTGKMIVKV